MCLRLYGSVLMAEFRTRKQKDMNQWPLARDCGSFSSKNCEIWKNTEAKCGTKNTGHLLLGFLTNSTE